MRKGQLVQVKSLQSERGSVLESLEYEYDRGTVGRVETEPDAVGWVEVKFPTCVGALQVPVECLQPASR